MGENSWKASNLYKIAASLDSIWKAAVLAASMLAVPTKIDLTRIIFVSSIHLAISFIGSNHYYFTQHHLVKLLGTQLGSIGFT